MPVPLDSLQPTANLCRSCNCDFGSVTAFDRHRIGKHDYTFLEGMRMEPAREDGRRCMDVEELEASGFVRNSRGRWSLERDLARGRALRHASVR
jgi:hypothetical protein